MEWPKYIMLLFVVFLANVYGVASNVKGVIAAVLTPFQDNKDVKLNYIPTYASYLASEGADGVLVGAIAREVPTLTLDERKNLLDAWVKAARPLNLSVVHEVGGLPIRDVLDLAKHSYSLDVDALMIIPNKDNMPTDVNSLVQYVSKVAQAAPYLPILYHHPRWLTNLNIVDIVRQLKDQNENFLGILCSLEDAENVAHLIRDKDHIFIDYHEEKADACQSGFFSNMCEATGVLLKQMQRVNRLVGDESYEDPDHVQDQLDWTQGIQIDLQVDWLKDLDNTDKNLLDEDEWTGWTRPHLPLELGNARTIPQTPTVTTTEKNKLLVDKLIACI